MMRSIIAGPRFAAVAAQHRNFSPAYFSENVHDFRTHHSGWELQRLAAYVAMLSNSLLILVRIGD
jgi:hypothetical protein